MGTGRGAKKHGAQSKKKKYKRKVWLCHRDKDIDQIQEELEQNNTADRESASQPASVEYDDDLPGGGQFYCAETGKHFISSKALEDHKKSRFYKRRIKDLKDERYSQATAEWAAGMTKEKLPPAHNKGA